MEDSAALRAEAARLVEAVGEVLDGYLSIDGELFSWKNTFGWNDVERLKPRIDPLIERMGSILDKAKAAQQAVAALDAEVVDRGLLEQFFKTFVSYADALKLAIQGMARVLGHIETKRRNKAEFKKVRYESDLMIYKSQVDKYQLYGQQLNPLLRQLG